MAQAEPDLEERILGLGWSVDFHSKELDACADTRKAMERRVDILRGSIVLELESLGGRIEELEIQVEKLSWWDPWLLLVYRWWYATTPIV